MQTLYSTTKPNNNNNLFFSLFIIFVNLALKIKLHINNIYECEWWCERFNFLFYRAKNYLYLFDNSSFEI